MKRPIKSKVNERIMQKVIKMDKWRENKRVGNGKQT